MPTSASGSSSEFACRQKSKLSESKNPSNQFSVMFSISALRAVGLSSPEADSSRPVPSRHRQVRDLPERALEIRGWILQTDLEAGRTRPGVATLFGTGQIHWLNQSPAFPAATAAIMPAAWALFMLVLHS